jgi:hypothetical protein
VKHSLLLLPHLVWANIKAQQIQSDNGDDTHINPFIYAYFPYPDIIESSHGNLKITAFTNPTHTEIHVSSNALFSSLFVSSLDGKKLICKKYSSPLQNTILSEDFKPGVYFLTLKNDKIADTIKVIIK